MRGIPSVARARALKPSVAPRLLFSAFCLFMFVYVCLPSRLVVTSDKPPRESVEKPCRRLLKLSRFHDQLFTAIFRWKRGLLPAKRSTRDGDACMYVSRSGGNPGERRRHSHASSTNASFALNERDGIKAERRGSVRSGGCSSQQQQQLRVNSSEAERFAILSTTERRSARHLLCRDTTAQL